MQREVCAPVEARSARLRQRWTSCAACEWTLTSARERCCCCRQHTARSPRRWWFVVAACCADTSGGSRGRIWQQKRMRAPVLHVHRFHHDAFVIKLIICIHVRIETEVCAHLLETYQWVVGVFIIQQAIANTTAVWLWHDCAVHSPCQGRHVTVQVVIHQVFARIQQRLKTNQQESISLAENRNCIVCKRFCRIECQNVFLTHFDNTFS